MKNLTRVVLPIAAIVGLVFLVTYMANYSTTDTSKKGDGNKGSSQVQPLKFPFMVAQAGGDWKFRNWNSSYEVGDKEGRFDFWFRNESDQAVRFAANGISCQCAGAYVAVIPQEAMNDYLVGPGRAAVHLPGMPGGPVLDALNVLKLNDKIQFKHVVGGGQKGEASIPGSTNPALPQFAILRLTWEAKPQVEAPDKDADVSITGNFVSQLPNANGALLELKALYSVVQPFHIYSGDRPFELRLGDLQPGASITREVIFWSKTRVNLRPVLELATPGNFSDCITWTQPAALNGDEIVQFEKKMQVADQPIKVRSASRIFVTVYEQRAIEVGGQKTTKKLDLGPLHVQISVAVDGSKPVALNVLTTVRGAIRITSGSDITDGVDFGRSFSSSESRTKSVNIISEVAGLDLEEVRAERTPDYLDVKLNPSGEKDRRKNWILEVTIPEKTLFGDLPRGSSVILQTKDSPPRRIRIPVKAKTLD